ncbi:protein-disulfide reductase DsbD domain-containing protein [Algibacter pectinivorans]|uniref:Disulphide bond corrector protein DsbC n=1 Tax=Algibacter pectinivorans TaxID=870482 RepID=A0A1I1RQE4_9FLAO|nr:protein-disulfide reductase DsbD domain-containing protein [Algibacter pectinivorans]SFD34488.1 Disulphide bond corrector protein DsbC [Algibacter pectinivorans]
MKKLVVIVVLLLSVNSFAQILDPINWTTDVKKISDSEYELIAIANIDTKWHLYSQTVPEGGPMPTIFSFVSNGHYLKKGNTKEEEGVTVDDPTFNMKVKYFETKTEFKQRIKLKKKPPFNIEAEIEYMVCDDKQCIMPEPENLSFSIQ